MTNQVKTIAAAVRRGPRSFDYIRSTTGLGADGRPIPGGDRGESRPVQARPLPEAERRGGNSSAPVASACS